VRTCRTVTIASNLNLINNLEKAVAWFLLLAAGAIEVVMAISLKYADGWTKPLPSAVGILAALGSIFLLTQALKTLPAGSAYAVWTGIGAVGVTTYGILALGESASPSRLVCIALVATGIVGLRMIAT
jgi:quaternary ammonium compound-resistance protein SugE